MRVEIFIVTYGPDAKWLDWALKSIGRFASGFSRVTVLAPVSDNVVIAPLCRKHGAKLLLDQRAPPPNGFVDHMIQKCLADQHCPDADYIFHTDSDVIFCEPATPETFFQNGKPIMLVEPYEHLRAVRNPAACWELSTRRILGWSPRYETMRRHGTVYPRDLYGRFRRYIEDKCHRAFREVMLAEKVWSEFNCLGSFAQQTCPDLFHTIDVSREPWPAHPLVQFWSLGAMDQPVDIWIKGQLRRVVPVEELRRILPD